MRKTQLEKDKKLERCLEVVGPGKHGRSRDARTGPGLTGVGRGQPGITPAPAMHEKMENLQVNS